MYFNSRSYRSLEYIIKLGDLIMLSQKGTLGAAAEEEPEEGE
jgi:hypothetical protein